MSIIKFDQDKLINVEYAKRGFIDVVITNYDKDNNPSSYETTFVIDVNKDKQPIDNESEEQ
jgi:hypothetical protein